MEHDSEDIRRQCLMQLSSMHIDIHEEEMLEEKPNLFVPYS